MGELICIAGGALRRGDEEAWMPLLTCGTAGMKAVLQADLGHPRRSSNFVTGGSAHQTLRNSRPPATLIHFSIQVRHPGGSKADYFGASGWQSPPGQILF
jgi:hypothetical protein